MRSTFCFLNSLKVGFSGNCKLTVFFFAALILVFVSANPSTKIFAAGPPDSFADLAQRLKPAVVNVSTALAIPSSHSMGDRPQAPPGSPFEDFFRDFFDRQDEDGSRKPRRKQSLGSGFIIDARGIVVTNNHVIANADEISVTLDDNRTFSATIIGRDKKTDLAVLRIENDTKTKLPFVRWGNSDTSRVGDWVIAIGNPFGLGGSVTAGIISARGRNINAGPYDNFIQTDASINRGNSGGPMFNLDGNVIGINTAIFSPSGGSVGIGFAIPANLAKRVVQQLVEFGRTQRGWLGVQIQTVSDEIAESLALGEARGALISRVNKDGPADKAGLQAGDIILEFAGKEVPEMRQLPRIVADTQIGLRVEVVIWRKGSKEVLWVVVGELVEPQETPVPSKVESEVESQTLGMLLSAISPKDRNEFKLRSDIKGVLIKGVANNGPAAERGIRPGDVIVEANQQSVSTPEQVIQMVEKVKGLGRKTILLLIDRSGSLRFVAISIGN